MKALVLAGGKGTRLAPLTNTMPKQLVSVANRPILHYVMDQIATSGIEEVGVIISPETGDQIRQSLDKNPWGFDLTYLRQEEPKGLAHAVKVARSFLAEDDFLMYLGDNLAGGSIEGTVREFQRSEADSFIMLKEVEQPGSFGIAEVKGDGEVTNLVEKPEHPPSNLALVGIYLFSPSIHEAIERIEPSDRGELEITDAIQQLLNEEKRVHSFQLDSWWLDTGKKDDLLAANLIVMDELIEKDLNGNLDDGSDVSGRVSLKQDVEIKGSRIRGPVVIGRGTRIENTFIGPYTSIGNDCEVNNTAIEHSVVLDGCKIEDVPRIEDSVLGRNAEISDGEEKSRALRLMLGENGEVSW